MAHINVDTSNWPVVVVHLPNHIEDADFTAYLEQLRRVREMRQQYALIIEASASLGFSARQRRQQADHIASGIELTRVHMKAFAFVAVSSLHRGMLTAIFWFVRPAWPHAVFASLREAQEWVRGHLGPVNG